jgi:hypothetical protein
MKTVAPEFWRRLSQPILLVKFSLLILERAVVMGNRMRSNFQEIAHEP